MDENQQNINSIFDQMKNSSINAVIIREDGIILNSTFSVEESNASLIAALSNTADGILRILKDKQKEMEISMNGSSFFIVNIETFLLCCVLKDKDQKALIREYAAKLKQVI